MQANTPALGYITSAEASLRLRCSQRYVSRLAEEGKIASLLVTRRLRLFSVSDVMKLAEQRVTAPSA